MLRREIQPHPVLWHNFRFYEPWTMNDCFFSDSDAAMPRQTQADNDASGSPQRVAGQPLRNRSQAMGTVCRWQAARFYRTQKDTAIGRMRRGRPNVKNNIVYILCKDILYTLCKHIVYKFLLIEALIFLLNEDRCESDKPVSSGILAYLRQSSR